MRREYFTVKLSGVEVDLSTRIRLEARFAELVERSLDAHEAILLACKAAAAAPQDAAVLRHACAEARAAMLEAEELPSCGRFSVRLSEVFDL
jgi:hypothetical protein